MIKLFRKIMLMAFFALFMFNSAFAYEYEDKTGYWFPLNRTLNHSSFGGEDLSIHLTCTVNKNSESALYEYTVALDFETTEKRLLSWNYLDWIFSNYPNAITNAFPELHLFPLNEGTGNYTFSFKTKEAPVWFKYTVVNIFPYDTSDTKRVDYNKESAEDIGVSVSSYDYISRNMAFGASSCLPYNLLAFPRNLRSGF